jgi:dTDP-glucose pyrophosphorylase
MSSNNTSGVKGVSWNKVKKLWEAEIGYNHQRKRLGYFKSLDLAEEFVDLARQLVHGDFANNGTHKGARYADV